MRNKKAFTFLEIMFGLAILGIISAMVIPVFFNAYTDRVRGTQLKRVCGQISYAIDSIMADERAGDTLNIDDEDDTNSNSENNSENEQQENTVSTGFYLTSAGVKTSNSTQGVEYFLNKYFKHIQVNCGAGGSNTCIGSSYRSPNKKSLGSVPNDFYCIRTTNSAAICMKYDDSAHAVIVIVDVNANEKPNITGSDTFVMYITSDGQLKDLDDDETHCNANHTNANIQNYASGCFTKVVTNGWKMSK